MTIAKAISIHNNIKLYWKWNPTSICLNLKARMFSNPHEVLTSPRLTTDKLPQPFLVATKSPIGSFLRFKILFPSVLNCLCHHPHHLPSQPLHFWFFLMSLRSLHLQLYQSGVRLNESHWSSGTQERSKRAGLQEHQNPKPIKRHCAHNGKSIYRL